MSEEKQLTVAEILARAQQENPDAGKRRRHRRSIEEGGVTVAELTGSLKKVDARPAESKHSSVPIDAPEEPEAVEQSHAAEPKFEQAQPAEPRKAASTRTDHTDVAPETAPEAKPQSTSSRITIAPAPVEKDSSEKAPADETAVIQKVEVAEEPAAKPTPAPAAASEPKAFPAAPVKERDLKEEPVQPLVPDSETARSAAPSRAAAVEQGESDPFDEGVPAEQIEVEEETINPIVLVLLIFLGVIAGILGFLVFQWVWANTGTAVAVGSAIAFVILVLFGVRALRTGKDGLTMTMAGIAAAVAAFGPALL
ncbi:hypothetical protein [Corynebacterium glaucum]|uniref:hypothetical protein n=1 Tax=Corynebacterium glaucum TaxID=187491 RepID=UPI00265A1FC3|nr:hypothetical protein [Corynebacterium glaucum]